MTKVLENLKKISISQNIIRRRQYREEIRGQIMVIRNIIRYPDHYNRTYRVGAKGMKQYIEESVRVLWKEYRAFTATAKFN